MQRKLNALQVAALLVSASYGIGFLFGSGEMALAHGMAGSLYGLATALGMLVLALVAARLWRTGLPIWDLFDTTSGSRLKQGVALLSVVWMSGVLATQIAGGVAVLELLGLPSVLAYTLVAGLIHGASRLDLHRAAIVLTLFLAASGAVLVLGLTAEQGGEIYRQAPVRFVADLASFEPAVWMTSVVAIIAVVCTGADYHQFVLAAKEPSAAIQGCILAGLCLAALSFLPPAVVMALKEGEGLASLGGSRQVIPFALLRTAESFGSVAGPIAGPVLLLGLSAAALGSGAAILRVMTSALGAATRGIEPATPARRSLAALVLGSLLAARGQGIVATMVSVNAIYIGSIAVCFAALLARQTLSPARATRIMAAGFVASLGVYLLHWAGELGDRSDLYSLLAGLIASGLVFLAPVRWLHQGVPGPLHDKPRDLL